MLMKQSSLDEPELVIDYDGARGGPGVEGDRDMNEYEEQQGFEDQFQYTASQHNQSESRSSTPESTKTKGKERSPRRLDCILISIYFPQWVYPGRLKSDKRTSTRSWLYRG